MGISAGTLRTRVELQERDPGGTDDWGQPSLTWSRLGEFSAAVKNETGLGAIRTSVSGGIPASIARYSFKVRAEVISHFQVNPAQRLLAKLPFNPTVFVFKITGVISDFSDTSQAYILAEVGGSEG